MISLVSVNIDEETVRAVTEVLRSGQLAEGPSVRNFEAQFADYTGVSHAVAVNSGTAALHASLIAAGIGPGDEVITTSFSFIATGNCCLYCGAVPVFADIDPLTYNIDPREIERKITEKTKAVIVVHLYGQPCDMDEIVDICRRNNLVLIEDACQSHGAEYKGNKTGTFGVGCFSFYATKNLLTGEGGMVTVGDEAFAERLRAIRNHGRSGQYVHDTLGYNYRMTDISAAIGSRQLELLPANTAKRNENAAYLTEEIGKLSGLIPPAIAPDRTHVFHQYTIRVGKEYSLSRNALQSHLKEHGIGSGVIYPVPIHKQPLYRELGYDDSLPVSEQAAEEVLSLPVHPYLTHDDLETIVRELNNAG